MPHSASYKTIWALFRIPMQLPPKGRTPITRVKQATMTVIQKDVIPIHATHIKQ